jgi:hypothetical protein
VKLYQPWASVVVVLVVVVMVFVRTMVHPGKPGSPLFIPLLFRSLNFMPQMEAVPGGFTTRLPKFLLAASLPPRLIV